MPFTSEQQEKIAAAIMAKLKVTGKALACPVCGHQYWSLVKDPVLIPLQPKLDLYAIGGQSLPAIATICMNCGNTQLHNVFILGVAELLGIKPSKAEEGGQTSG